MVSNYKVFFNDMIWSRGNAYYAAGKVLSIQKSGSNLIAKVQGTSPYFVTFTTDPVSMSCTCPYADDGHKCKHMAAAFIAYENMNKSNVEEKIGTKRKSISYTQCSWYSYVEQSFNKKGTMHNISLFYKGIENYLYEIGQAQIRSSDTYVKDLFLLIQFVEKFIVGYYYGVRDLYDGCIQKLNNLRTFGNTRSKDQIDKEMRSLLLHASSEDLMVSIIENYVNQEKDYSTIEQFLTGIKYTNTLINTIMEILQRHNVDKEKLEEFSLKFNTSLQARSWLIHYYKESNQYEKGIHFLESYCYSDAKINQDTHMELYALFQFYTKCNHITSRDALLELLLKNRKVDKAGLFKTLKAGMDEYTWHSSGKTFLRNWAKGKNEETCYRVFNETDAADLMFEKLINDGFTTYTLRKYFPLLSSYDEGIVYSMYKLTLKHKIDTQPSSIQWILSNFYDDFPKTKNATEALKMILVEMQNEYQGDHKVRMALESLEETLYEEENR